METKPLLYGLIGFIAGGLLVSIIATTMDTDTTTNKATNSSQMMEINDMTMSQMSGQLRSKTDDDFDKGFIADMIEHHEGAIEMAKLADGRAKHSEIKTLSENIIKAQESEITQMKQWQKDWGYTTSSSTHNMMMNQ